MTLVPLVQSWCFFATKPQWRIWARLLVPLRRAS